MRSSRSGAREDRPEASEQGKFSCHACRDAKRSCDRRQPCGRCQRRGLECIMQARGRGRPKRNAAEGSAPGAGPDSEVATAPADTASVESGESSAESVRTVQPAEPIFGMDRPVQGPDPLRVAFNACARSLARLQEQGQINRAKAASFATTIEFLFMMAGLDYAGTEFAACLSRLGKGTEAWDSPNGQVIKTGPGSAAWVAELMVEPGAYSVRFVLSHPDCSVPREVRCNDLLSSRFVSTGELESATYNLNSCYPPTMARLMEPSTVQAAYESMIVAMFSNRVVEGQSVIQLRDRHGKYIPCVCSTRVHWLQNSCVMVVSFRPCASMGKAFVMGKSEGSSSSSSTKASKKSPVVVRRVTTTSTTTTTVAPPSVSKVTSQVQQPPSQPPAPPPQVDQPRPQQHRPDPPQPQQPRRPTRDTGMQLLYDASQLQELRQQKAASQQQAPSHQPQQPPQHQQPQQHQQQYDHHQPPQDQQRVAPSPVWQQQQEQEQQQQQYVAPAPRWQQQQQPTSQAQWQQPQHYDYRPLHSAGQPQPLAYPSFNYPPPAQQSAAVGASPATPYMTAVLSMDQPLPAPLAPYSTAALPFMHAPATQPAPPSAAAARSAAAEIHVHHYVHLPPGWQGAASSPASQPLQPYVTTTTTTTTTTVEERALQHEPSGDDEAAAALKLGDDDDLLAFLDGLVDEQQAGDALPPELDL